MLSNLEPPDTGRSTTICIQGVCVQWLFICTSDLLLSSAHSLKEGNERHESFIISRVTELLHQRLGLLLGQLLTKVGQQSEQLVGKHGVVVIFVIKLQDLNKVVESSLVLAVLAGLVHGEDLSLGQHLLSLLLSSSNLSDGLEGWVQVTGSDQISSIEGINLAISLEVIDIKGEFDGVNFLLLKTKFSHCYLLCRLKTCFCEYLWLTVTGL